MSEENTQSEQQPAETAAPEAAQPEAQAAEPKDTKPKKVEIPKNCGSCKKPIHKIRYYRNMQFFCNTKCWKTFKKAEEKRKKEEAEKQTQEQPA